MFRLWVFRVQGLGFGVWGLRLVQKEEPGATAVRPRPLTTPRLWIEGGRVSCARAPDSLRSVRINDAQANQQFPPHPTRTLSYQGLALRWPSKFPPQITAQAMRLGRRRPRKLSRTRKKTKKKKQIN